MKRVGRTKRRIAALLVVTVFSVVALWAQEVDTTDFLERIDENMTLAETDFFAVMTFVSQYPEEGIDRRKVRIFRRDRDGAYVLLVLEPEVNRGQGYLQVDDALWFYDPESRSFSYTSQSESFQGTDARVSDFSSSSLSEDYTITSAERGTLGNYEVYILELEATNDEVTYPQRKLWVTRDNLLTLKSEDYSVTERLLRTTYIPRYTRLDDAFIATRMILEDELVEGKKTTIAFDDVSTAELPDSVFTKSYVERVSR
jgi:hypothetical protein